MVKRKKGGNGHDRERNHRHCQCGMKSLFASHQLPIFIHQYSWLTTTLSFLSPTSIWYPPTRTITIAPGMWTSSKLQLYLPTGWHLRQSIWGSNCVSNMVVLLFKVDWISGYPLFHSPKEVESTYLPSCISPFNHVPLLVGRGEVGSWWICTFRSNG